MPARANSKPKMLSLGPFSSHVSIAQPRCITTKRIFPEVYSPRVACAGNRLISDLLMVVKPPAYRARLY
jgi:hypothetical protein